MYKERIDKKINEFINKNKFSRKCPVCRDSVLKYSKDTYFMQMLDYNEIDNIENKTANEIGKEMLENMNEKKEAMPIIVLVCEKCGYIMNFSAVISGILDEKGNICP